MFLYNSNYVDQPTAQAQNLTFASGNTFIMRADFTSTLNPSGPGRNSVRIQSNAQVENGVIAYVSPSTNFLGSDFAPQMGHSAYAGRMRVRHDCRSHLESIADLRLTERGLRLGQ